MFSILWKEIRLLYQYNTDKIGKYQLKINTKLDYYVKINIIIDDAKKNNSIEYQGFDKFTYIKLQSLIECFLKEIFIYYNFKTYNLES